MKIKKIIAWLLVLALTAAVSIGATLAYLTDTDEDVNVMTLGNVKIDQLEYERIDTETQNDDATVQEFHDNKPLIPAVTKDGFDYTPGTSYVDWEQIGKEDYTSPIWNPDEINNEVDKMVFVKNKGDYDAYVRTVFAFEAGKYTTLDQFKQMVHLNLNETDYEWEWVATPVTIGESTYFVATATYNKVLAPGALTEISLSQIALDKTATNEDVEAFGDTYQVLVKSQAIQADGFDHAADALNEGFGVVDATNIPWENDSPTKGVSLFNALHYLEGDTSTSAITANVSTITFGLNEDYAAITAKYDGTLIDVEQDVPVYAYYVPNGGHYDIYCLADDTIYAPADSTKLCNGMSALTAVNTDNLDTSRTTNMNTMFQNCSSLTSLDASGWATSKVTDMTGMFNKCTALTSVDVSTWDTSKVTSMNSMFNNCEKLQSVDVSSWDVSKVETFYRLFRKCYSITEIKGLPNWNPESATTMTSMFYQCRLLEDVGDLSNWDTGNVKEIQWMFFECATLESLDLSDWDTHSMTTICEAFYSCSNLKEVDVSGWDTGAVTNMSSAFSRCPNLQTLDVADWDVSNVQNFYCFAYNCASLTKLDVSNWNPSSATTLQYFVGGCSSLESLDVSGWDVSNVQDFYGFVYNCGNLTKLDVSNWDTGSGTRMAYMFAACGKLEALDVSGWDVSNVTNMDRLFGGCITLEYLDVSKWDVSNVQLFTGMFSGAGSNAFDSNLKELDLSNWQPESATDLSYMFYGCAKLTELDLSDWNMPYLKTSSHMFADCSSLEIIDVSGWNTPSLTSMDAMFNDCRSLKTVDVSTFDTSNVLEFSQLFDCCWSLTEIKGLENWDTTSAATFTEMFLSCGSLKELNLSSFSTYTARDGYYTQNNSWSNAFTSMFSGVSSLEKLTLGADFCFSGNGSVAEANQVKLPKPAGTGTLWYNAANDTYYEASEIPEKTAATYVAAVPTNP